MDILVCVKQVLDTSLPLQVTTAGAVAQREPWPVFTFNWADRAALEAALRLRAEIAGCRVTALTVGPARAETVLAHCLARGVDRLVHLRSDESACLDAFSVAQVLGSEIRKRGFDLVLCGDRAEDDGAGEVGPALAEILGIAQVTGAVKLSLSPQERKLVAERKLERGYRQVVEADLPVLVTADPALAPPRYVTRWALDRARGRLAEDGEVVVLADEISAAGPALRQVVGVAPPRPRPKRTARPDASASAEDRLAMVMGMAAPAKSAARVLGGAERLADEIVAFLREKGFLS